MPLRIQCSQCGKLLLLGPGSGTVIVCPACGTVQRAPAYDFIQDVQQPPPVNPQVFYNPVYNVPPAAKAPQPQPPIRRKPNKNNWWVTVGVAAAVVAVFLGILFVARGWNTAAPAPAPAPQANGEALWEQQNRGKIYALSNQAASFLAENKLPDALKTYQSLQALVEDHTIQDDNLLRCVQNAAVNQEQLVEKLIDSDQAPNGATSGQGTTTASQSSPSPSQESS
ncbi:MAG TPA: hypothetical protein VMD30_06145, partial [Tepidisphaeraceae bacterium]|nr:hypothetical protein [Tepidisphaeraceae bacterium]